MAAALPSDVDAIAGATPWLTSTTELGEDSQKLSRSSVDEVVAQAADEKEWTISAACVGAAVAAATAAAAIPARRTRSPKLCMAMVSLLSPISVGGRQVTKWTGGRARKLPSGRAGLTEVRPVT